MRVVANNPRAHLAPDVLNGTAADEVLVVIVSKVVSRVLFSDPVEVVWWVGARWSGADAGNKLPLGRGEGWISRRRRPSIFLSSPTLPTFPQSHHKIYP